MTPIFVYQDFKRRKTQRRQCLARPVFFTAIFLSVFPSAHHHWRARMNSSQIASAPPAEIERLLQLESTDANGHMLRNRASYAELIARLKYVCASDGGNHNNQ